MWIVQHVMGAHRSRWTVTTLVVGQQRLVVDHDDRVVVEVHHRRLR